MKKHLTKVLAAVTMLTATAVAPQAFADDACVVQPTQVYQFKTGDVSIWASNFYSSTGSVYLCNRNTDGVVCDNWLSIAEAAMLSGRKLRIKMPGITCGSLPYVERPSINWIYLF